VDISALLAQMSTEHASDVFLSHGAPPAIVVAGVPRFIGDKALTPIDTHEIAYSIMSDRQQKEFEATLEMSLGIAPAGLGRFRVSIYRQRGEIAIAIRYIPTEIPSIETLRLPDTLQRLIMLPRGLILVVGATGSGKSTTLASMLDYRNRTKGGHILTIEDPVEYLHQHRKSIIDQREVGIDTLSYANALRNAMREAPNVIMIGEIRDRETMTAAISYALSGHLVLSTLHANNSYHALGRILSFYAPEARPALLADLAAGLRAIVSQRLIRSVAGGRMPAVEVLLNTKLIQELIERGDFSGVKEAMEKSMAEGSQSFEQDLARMINTNLITRDEGLAYADSPTNLMWRMQNDMTPVSRIVPKKEENDDQPSFTEITIDVRPEEVAGLSPNLRRF